MIALIKLLILSNSTLELSQFLEVSSPTINIGSVFGGGTKWKYFNSLATVVIQVMPWNKTTNSRFTCWNSMVCYQNTILIFKIYDRILSIISLPTNKNWSFVIIVNLVNQKLLHDNQYPWKYRELRANAKLSSDDAAKEVKRLRKDISNLCASSSNSRIQIMTFYSVILFVMVIFIQ